MATRICPRCEAPNADAWTCGVCGVDLSDLAPAPAVRPLDAYAMRLASNERLVTAYFDGGEEMDFAVRSGVSDAAVVEAARAWAREFLVAEAAEGRIELWLPSCGTVAF